MSYVEQGLYWTYLKNRAVYYCPLDPPNTNILNFKRRIQRVSSYVMNGAVCGFGALEGHKPNMSYKISDFSPAAYAQWEPAVLNFGGYYAYNSGQDASQNPNDTEGIGKRHVIGGIVMGFDGRAHFISFKKFHDEAASPAKGLLWCNPGTSNGH
jgi:hypothetical protein